MPRCRLPLLFALLALTGCSSHVTSPLADSLERLPAVTVTKRISSTPKRQIVQIDDWHVVRRDHFIISQRANNPQLTDAEIDAAYTKHLAEVEAVQAEQLAVLRHLIRDHAVQTVYLEGFAVEEIDVLTVLLVESKHELASEFAMELGAAGKLWKAGELKNVLPAETRSLS